MGSVNRVTILGRLGADPELKTIGSGRAVCNLRVATSEVFKDKSGQKQERTEWHRITIWGDQAEHCAKYLSKGREVYLEGKIQTRQYDKDGEKRYSTEIVADRVVFLGGGGERSAGGGKHREEHAGVSAARAAFPGASEVSEDLIRGDDVPF
jgi:single-strand DNA-binding protein